MQKGDKKNKLQQPSSSYSMAYEYTGKDFGTLINAPLSKGGHFVFKSEKAWNVDSSQYSEFFTLNLKTLSAAIDCIPFNEYVDVADRYFTSDQLTSMHNNAEKSKAVYNTILKDLKASSSLNNKSEFEEGTKANQSIVEFSTNTTLKNSTDDLEDDLNFLLSLKEPVQSTAIKITQPMSLPSSHNNDSKMKSRNVPNKPIDLEKWLDSILDD